MRINPRLFFLALLVCFSTFVDTNISGVMGPNVDVTDRSFQFRTAFSDPDYDSQKDSWL
jgi:hypothetical protein